MMGEKKQHNIDFYFREIRIGKTHYLSSCKNQSNRSRFGETHTLVINRGA